MFVNRLTIVLALVACGEKTIDETEEEIIDVDGDGIEASLDCDDSSADLGAIESQINKLMVPTQFCPFGGKA